MGEITYRDRDLLDYLDRAGSDGTIPDALSRVLDAANQGAASIRAAIAAVAFEDGHEAEPIGTVPVEQADFAFLEADHGRLQWAFMLIDDGKVADLREAVRVMREKA